MNAHTRPGDRSATRNRYYKRKILSADDFTAEQNYMIGRRRLLNRSLYGWGVVYGLDVQRVGAGELAVTPGLALDECGRELVVTSDHRLCRSNLFVLDPDTCKPLPVTNETVGKTWLLSAHYAEHRIERIHPCDKHHCDDEEWDRVRETVVFSLSQYRTPQEKTCETIVEGTIVYGKRHDLNCQAFLCDWSQKHIPESDHPLCRWEHDIWIDPCRDVPLAVVEVTAFQCDKPVFGEVEVCKPRHTVKRNDLLFDLFNRCSLTRITKLSWQDWTQKGVVVEWGTFKSFFAKSSSVQPQPAVTPAEVAAASLDPERGEPPPAPAGAGESERVTGFSVEFSAPVQIETLRPEAFCMTAYFRGPGTDDNWHMPRRVPIVRILPEAPVNAVTSKATIVVDEFWCDDEIENKTPSFGPYEQNRTFIPFIEIEIHGDLILDCFGVPVDANSFGPRIVTTGNGTPGGVCRSVFRVAPPPPRFRR